MLEKVSPNPVLAPGASDRPNVDYFTLQMDHINGKRIHGQVAKLQHCGASFPAW